MINFQISSRTYSTMIVNPRSRVSIAIEIRWNWVWEGNATFRMNVRSIGRVATGTGSARVRHPPLLIRGMLLIIHLILRPLQIIDKLPSAIKTSFSGFFARYFCCCSQLFQLHLHLIPCYVRYHLISKHSSLIRIFFN